jgi:putative drug exporter of the RND superfamily
MLRRVNSVQIAPHPASHRVHEPATRPAPLERYGRLVARRRRIVLLLFALGLAVSGVLGSQLFDRLQSQGFDDPGSDSAAASTALADDFGVRDPVAVLAVEASVGVDDPAAVRAATTLVADLVAEPAVTDVVSYWTSGRPDALRGDDGRTAQVLVFADASTAEDEEALAADLLENHGGTVDGLVVHVGGGAAVGNALNETITEDLARAESIAVPVTLVLLLLVFGSVVSAGLPFSVAGGAILGSFLAVWLVSLATDVSVFALNLITGLGLGLGIDYALLVVNRFREELAAGRDTEDAVGRTVATAGRTVIVSGVTVAAVLGALLLFPQYFLRSFGYAGIAVTLIAVVTALTALPALLAMLGPRVDRLRVRRGRLAPADEGGWSRVARLVMRRPWPVLVGVLALLGVLASPALSVSFGQVDHRALPQDVPAAEASRILAERFDGQEASPVDVVLADAAGAPAQVAAYAAELSLLPGVTRVTTPTEVVVEGDAVAPNPEPGSFVAVDDVRLSVVADVEPTTREGSDLVDHVRAVDAPGTQTLVGGAAAEFTDTQQAMVDMAPLVLLWVAAATLLVLFLYTGSVVLPVKAVLLNVISLGAMLGVLVWVFQNGNLSWLVGAFVLTGSLDTAMIVLIAIVAFALSMDYEVFLLSRIKEEHDAGRDTTTAVALGLQRSGRIITYAALLLSVVFASFVTSGVTNIKQLGFGVALAILVDATIVRGLLVPAFMRLAGRWNWWAPTPLAALHRRIGLSDG